METLWAAGNTHYTNGVNVVMSHVARFNSDGSLNSSFDFPEDLANQYVNQIVYCPLAAIVRDGEAETLEEHLLLAGGFGVLSTSASGTSSQTFMDDTGHGSCVAERDGVSQLLCPNPFGEILAGGDFEPRYAFPSDSYLSFWLNRFGGSLGTYHNISKTNYPVDQGSAISSIIALPGGDALIGGYFTSIGSHGVTHFAHILADGSLDLSFQNSSGFPVTAMAMQPDGKIVLVGISNYTPLTGQIARRMALPDPSDAAFEDEPQDETVYAGEYAFFNVSTTGWPPPNLQWFKDGTAISNETSDYLSLSSVTADDAGDYFVRATNNFCTSAQSITAHLTVLPAPPAPTNDNFADAIPLSGESPTATGTLRSSTLEPGEPDHADNSIGHSVWWTWTATKSGTVVIDSSASDVDAAVGVYTGNNVSELTLAANNCQMQCDDGCYCVGSLKIFSFEAVAGTTYKIAAGGQPDAGSLGQVSLHLETTNPTRWIASASGTTKTFNSAAYGNGVFVAVGEQGLIRVSADGIHWDNADYGDEDFINVRFLNGRFVSVGYNVVLTSLDGTNWNEGESPEYAYFNDVAFGNGNYYIASDSGYVFRSPDTTNWTSVVPDIDIDSLYAMTFDGTRFLAAGAQGAAYTFESDSNWTQVFPDPDNNDFFAANFSNGIFVLVGNNGVIATSTNGTDWTTAAIGSQAFWNIAFGNGRFVAVGDSGAIATSANGVDWTFEPDFTDLPLYGVACGEGRTVVCGVSGTLFMTGLPQFTETQKSSDGTIRFHLNAPNNATVIIDAAENLSSEWIAISTNQVVDGSVSVTTTPSGHEHYFRVRMP